MASRLPVLMEKSVSVEAERNGSCFLYDTESNKFYFDVSTFNLPNFDIVTPLVRVFQNHNRSNKNYAFSINLPLNIPLLHFVVKFSYEYLTRHL